MLRERWRLWRGRCPGCNSEAPALLACPICRGWWATAYPHEPTWWKPFGYTMTQQPSSELKREWWRRYRGQVH